ncbi:MAG: hypothetical protein LBQ04_03420 [Endomicrobium sp.]|jgi:hypothetical protein|nr:hypothetical protein [Endomicrobium sp.]
MKKLVLAIFVMFFTVLAYSATPAEVNECDRQCYACESGYKLWRDTFELIKEAIQYCRDALNFCKSIGEDCPKAREIISNENEGL